MPHPCIRAAFALFALTTALAAAEPYRLGAGDTISLRVANEPDVSRGSTRIAHDGTVHVDLVGRIEAAGRTAEELESAIASGLRRFVRDPQVSISVVEYGSQPVSVLGSVRDPGVHQLGGSKTLVEVLSAAGGVSDDAGYTVTLTRRIEWGAVPVEGATPDSEGRFSVARIDLQDLIEGRSPSSNIAVMPHDVIAVPRANLVYVIGSVERSGGFALREREQISVLEALALAGGIDRVASLRRAKILRASAGKAERQEIPVDLRAVMADNAPDLTLEREDILFVPSSTGKRVGLAAASAVVNVGTGAAIWRASRR